MPAAVYLGDGEIAVRELDVPTLGPDGRAGRGVALRHLRHRPAPRARAVRPARQRARSRMGGHDRGGRDTDVHGWEIGARVVQNPTPGCGECRACKRGRSSVCLRREPPDLLDFTRGAFCRYKVVPRSRLLRVPDSLSTRRRAHRADRDRDPHRQPLRAHTRRPRARDRRRPGRSAHDRGAAARGDRRRHRLRARAAPARARPGGRRRRVIEPGDLPRAPMGRPVAEPYTIAFECSGNAAAAGVGVRPARLRGHARVRRHRPRHAAHQPQPRDRARALRSSPRTTTTSRASRPRSSCSRRAGSRSTRSSRPTTCCSTTCSARCTASRPASCPARSWSDRRFALRRH